MNLREKSKMLEILALLVLIFILAPPVRAGDAVCRLSSNMGGTSSTDVLYVCFSGVAPVANKDLTFDMNGIQKVLFLSSGVISSSPL